MRTSDTARVAFLAFSFCLRSWFLDLALPIALNSAWPLIPLTVDTVSTTVAMIESKRTMLEVPSRWCWNDGREKG